MKNNNYIKLTRNPEMKLEYRGTVFVFNKMDRIELNELREYLQDDLDSINAQLADAKATRIKTGKYADIDWFNSAILAKRLRGRAVQAIQIELSKRNKERSKDRPLSEYFVDVAKEFLVRDTFDDILSEAEYRKEGELYEV